MPNRMKLDTKQLAQLALSRGRRQDVDVPADALHELEHQVKLGSDVMEEDAGGRSPHQYATAHAEEALVNYALWQYFNTPKTANIAQGFRSQWKDALRRWERAAAREAGKESLEETPYESTADKLKKQVERDADGFTIISPVDDDRRFN